MMQGHLLPSSLKPSTPASLAKDVAEWLAVCSQGHMQPHIHAFQLRENVIVIKTPSEKVQQRALPVLTE